MIVDVTEPVAATSRRRHEGPLRVAVIGAGKMGQQHIKAIQRLANASLVAIADPTCDANDRPDSVPTDVRIFADAQAMLDGVRPDVVHIVTPPPSHAALATAALEAGSHVYVEKPFTPSAAEARAILDLAAARGLSICAGHQCLVEEASVGALRHLPEIGRLVHVESFLSFRTVRRGITPVDQAKDILPHAVYPLVEQLRAATGSADTFQVKTVDASAAGDVYALVRLGSCAGVVILTLNGRPVEQYQRLVGTNGSLRADYVIGRVVRLLGPGTGPGILFTPYRRALSTLVKATSGFAGLVLGKTGSYRGLQHLIGQFYSSIQQGTAAPVSPRSIVDTVTICEQIGNAFDAAEYQSNLRERARLEAEEAALPRLRPAGPVLVTGGTGFLGRRVVLELRTNGYGVRVVARRMPGPSQQIAGVEYLCADLSRPLPPPVMAGVSVVAHCAAETAGGQKEHQRNSLAATQYVLEAAARAGVTRVINVSSLAVLKRAGGALDEETPVDSGNLERGPYVWGKAEAERTACDLGKSLNIQVKTIRPGPLVNYDEFTPPGRLGREIGPVFVAVGGKRAPLSVCDVATAARVIRSYVDDFDAAPERVNLVEVPPPQRRELAARLRAIRPDLRVVWVPGVLVRLLNRPAMLIQRMLRPAHKPVDVYAAFASEQYRTEVAESVIARAIRH